MFTTGRAEARAPKCCSRCEPIRKRPPFGRCSSTTSLHETVQLAPTRDHLRQLFIARRSLEQAMHVLLDRSSAGGPGRLTVSAWRTETHLEIELCDRGPVN